MQSQPVLSGSIPLVQGVDRLWNVKSTIVVVVVTVLDVRNSSTCAPRSVLSPSATGVGPMTVGYTLSNPMSAEALVCNNDPVATCGTPMSTTRPVLHANLLLVVPFMVQSTMAHSESSPSSLPDDTMLHNANEVDRSTGDSMSLPTPIFWESIS
ncbi:hypothetical protein V6N13_033607 [Hibiscus sabdariffa]